jgi:hypothetical protein
MHGKTFSGLAAIVVLSLVFSFSFTGCVKEKKAEAKSALSQVANESTGTDTSDIFKEFYSEDTAAKKPEKSAKPQTFSPAASSPPPTLFSSNGRYIVQVSCVKSNSFANAMALKLIGRGYPAYVAEVQNPTPVLSGNFYRVRIGGFDHISSAKSFGQNTLVPNGHEYWIDKKSNDNVGMEGYGLGSGNRGSNAADSYNYEGASESSTTSSYESGKTPSSLPSSSATNTPAASTSTASSSAPAAASASTSTGASSSAPAVSASTSTAATSSAPAASASTSTAATSSAPAASASTAASSGASTSPTTKSAPSSGTQETSGSGNAAESGSSGWGKDSSSGGW